MNTAVAAARAEILAACREAYRESPSAWIGWEPADVEDFETLEQAAHELVAEGLIRALFGDEHTAVEAQLTAAGLKAARA